MECIMGATTIAKPGRVSLLRLVMLKWILSPTRARTAGPGTWSPKVQALNCTPGAISTTLCVVSSCTNLTGAGSSGLSSALKFSEAPLAKVPVCLCVVSVDGGDFNSMSLARSEPIPGFDDGPQAVNSRTAAVLSKHNGRNAKYIFMIDRIP